MMACAVSLEMFKRHVYADDFSGDDAYMEQLLDAAVGHVVRVTHRSIDELVELGGGCFPVELVQAVLMLAGHWYNQRESVSATQMHAVPDSLQSLVKPFRKLAP